MKLGKAIAVAIYAQLIFCLECQSRVGSLGEISRPESAEDSIYACNKPEQSASQIGHSKKRRSKVEIVGVRIDKAAVERLSEEFDNQNLEVVFEDCIFEDGFKMPRVEARSISFIGCTARCIAIQRLKLSGAFKVSRSWIDESIIVDYASMESMVIDESIVGLLSRSNGDWSVRAVGMSVSGFVDINHSVFIGGLLMMNSKVSDQVLLDDSLVMGDFGLDQCNIERSLSVKNTKIIRGSLEAPLSIIGGNIDLHGTQLRAGRFAPSGNGRKKRKPSLYLGGMKLGGSVHLKDGFRCPGIIDISDAKVGAGIDLVGEARSELVDLSSTECRRLRLGENMKFEAVRCNGFVFQDVDYENMINEKGRFDFQLCEDFCKSAVGTTRQYSIFKQFARSFDSHGDSIKAVGFRMLSEESKYKDAANDSKHMWLWYNLGWVTGYGFKPLRIIWAMLVWYLIAVFIFWRCEKHILKAKRDGGVVSVNPFWFALETMLPFVKLGHAEHFDIRSSYFAFAVYSLHVLVGWFLTTWLLAGVSGLISPLP